MKKTCSTCGKEYPRSADYFYRDKTNPDGLAYKCKICCKPKNRRRSFEIKNERDRNKRQICSRCKKNKRLIDFGLYKNGKNGRNKTCKQCEREARELKNKGLKVCGFCGEKKRILQDFPPGSNLCYNCNPEYKLPEPSNRIGPEWLYITKMTGGQSE